MSIHVLVYKGKKEVKIDTIVFCFFLKNKLLVENMLVDQMDIYIVISNTGRGTTNLGEERYVFPLI